jgi:uncharacterized phage protein (TIGR02218 family)
MSYSEFEYSEQNARPVFRFLFAQGAVEYRYTTETRFVADSNGTFSPAPIVASEISQTNEMAKDDLKLDFPRDNPFAALFLGGVPETVTTVTVFRGHDGDTDEEFQFYWKGRVAGASATGDVVTIECENIFTSMRRPGLRARYQKTCRHALYQSGCNVDKGTFAIVATATAVDGFAVTISGWEDSNTDANYFVSGMLETEDGFFRYITSHAGNQITLIRPLQSLSDVVNSSVGEAQVTLYPGCAHTINDCKTKFNNLNNFGGFAWIPAKNPFANAITGSIV